MMVADSDLIKAATDFESMRSRKSFFQRRTGASQHVMNKMDSEFSGCKLTCCLFVRSGGDASGADGGGGTAGGFEFICKTDT